MRVIGDDEQRKCLTKSCLPKGFRLRPGRSFVAWPFTMSRIVCADASRDAHSAAHGSSTTGC